MDSNLQTASADRKPPALPIKQRRSHSSSTSSAPDLQLEGILNLPGSSPLPSPFTEVFTAPTDCNAVQCPIHHHCGTSGLHQGRFFSDQTPPPIPKKRLVRTLSLPAGTLFKPKRPHHYENPLLLSGEDEKEEKSRCFNQLNFDTPDHHLPGFFHSFLHQEQVYVSIQNRYLEFLRSTVMQLEARVLLQEHEVETVRTLQPQDFVIREEVQPEKTEQDVYFMVNVPKLPDGVFSAKTINNESGQMDPKDDRRVNNFTVTTEQEVNRTDFVSTCPAPTPHHPNTEETVTYFTPGLIQEKHQLSKLPTTTETELSQEGSAKLCEESDTISEGQTVLAFLERGLSVSIVRDFPWGTLEDFARDGVSLHCSQPDVYERRLCLLMLQLALGLQHLEIHDVNHAELRPKRIMLVWGHAKNKELLEKLEAGGDPNGERNRFQINSDTKKIYHDPSDLLHENRGLKRVQELWGKWATPRLVVVPAAVQAEPSQNVPTNGLQLGALLKHCLHYNMNIHQTTQYTPGLLYLINQLTSDSPGLQMVEIAGVLQALLWGPRAGLFEKNQPNTTVLQNWLVVKRSLLVLKLAERGLSLNQDKLDWEDYLCLQYLTLAEPETLLKTTALLGLYDVSLV